MLLKEGNANVNLIIFKCAANRGKQRVVIGDIRLLFLKNYGRFQSTANTYVSGGDGSGSSHEEMHYLPSSPEQGKTHTGAFITQDDAPF